MKIVLDSNVLISAFATHGLCHLVFESVIAQHDLVIGPTILEETKKYLLKKVKVSAKYSNETISFLTGIATLGSEKKVEGLKCRDKKDLNILYLSVNAQVDTLVTGDSDLLVLKKVKDIPIMTPRDFWAYLKR